MRPTLANVENAFQPAKEVDDPARFAGRKDAITESLYALISNGSHIAVVGNRGIGKSSLARQIIKLSKGDSSLLDTLDVLQEDRLDFLTVYLACGSSVQNTSDLLHRLLTTNTCLADWIYEIPKASKLVEAYNPKLGANLIGVELALSGEKKTELESEAAVSSHALETVFTNTACAILEENISKNGILIVVDEFDQIADPKGFASFLKALSTNVPNVKFCLVGVAQDIQYLMKEHQSSDRLFAGSIISLPSMSDEELEEIIVIAQGSIGNYIQFSTEAIERVCALAKGHPYLVHLIGKYAFRLAFREDIRIILPVHIEQTLSSIASRGADPVLEGRYKKAVGSSAQREIVLKAMAESQAADGEIWTANAYKLALDRGVDNSSQYVGQLVLDEYGEEIEKIRDRFYRFHDSLFAAYVLARPYLVAQI